MNLLTVTQAAQHLGCARITVQKLIERKRLDATRAGPLWLIDPQALARVKLHPGPGRPPKQPV